MTRPTLRRLALTLATAATSLALMMTTLAPRPAAACGGLYPPDEQVIDHGNQQRMFASLRDGQQTLVLQPSLVGDARSFGLLVPVPARPELSDETPASFFDDLDRLTGQAEGVGGTRGTPNLGAQPGSDGVEVVESLRVGAYDAQVLTADSSSALVEWLGQNGYAYDDHSGPTFDYYVSKKFHFVGLKVALDAQSPEAFYEGDLPPITLRFAAQSITLPMKIAYSGDNSIDWTVYTSTSSALVTPAQATVQFASQKVDSTMLSPYQLGQHVRAGDLVSRLRFSFTAADLANDLVLAVVTSPEPTPAVPTTGGDDNGTGAGCSVAGPGGAASTGAPLLALLALGLAARLGRSRRR